MLNEKEILINSLKNEATSYMTKEVAKVFLSKLENPDYYKDTKTPREDILNLLENKSDIASKLNEFEYDFSYRFVVLSSFENQNLDELIQEAQNNNKIINNNILSTKIELPRLKKFDNDYDLKFNFIENNPNNKDEKIKNPIIITILTDKKLILFKYNSIYTNDLDVNNLKYAEINLTLQNWLQDNLQIQINYVNTIILFKKYFLDIYKNNIESTSFNTINDDEIKKIENVELCLLSSRVTSGGTTAFERNDDSTLPIITGILKSTNSFESDNDKDIIRNYLREFVEKSLYLKVGFIWNGFQRKNYKILATTEKKEYIDNENIKKYFFHIHFFKKYQINRERINYVITELSKYL